MRFHVHAIVVDRLAEEEIATVTVTIDAEDDADAQTATWELFDEDLFRIDVTEIEEAE